MITLEKVKKYLRIDSDVEDDLIQNFLDVAESYLSNAITNYATLYQSNEKFSAQADLLKMIIVAESYYNRDGRNDPRKDFSFVIRSMVNQLQYFATGEKA